MFADMPGVIPVRPRPGDPYGLVALGGSLSPETVLAAYRQGVFPWTGEDPIPWCSPDPRAVILPGGFHASRSLEKTRRRGHLRVTWDKDFAAVIRACATIARRHEAGTWIAPNVVACYSALHARGVAHSVEVWADEALVGGLYGLVINGVFCGESMFSRVDDASKLALWHVAERDFAWVDCQAMTPHLRRLGAVAVPRSRYHEMVRARG